MNISPVNITSNINFAKKIKNDPIIQENNVKESTNNKKIAPKIMTITLLGGLGVLTAHAIKNKSMSFEKFVKKGGFIEDNTIKIKDLKGQTKNFTGKVKSVWKDCKDKTINEFKIKDGKVKQFNFMATEQVADPYFYCKYKTRFTDLGDKIKHYDYKLDKGLIGLTKKDATKNITTTIINKAEEVAKKKDELISYFSNSLKETLLK